MAYDYSRTAKVPFESVLHKAAEADDALTKVYLALHSLKFGLDGMEEIPKDLLPLYRQIMKTLDTVTTAQKETYQTRMMVRKIAANR